MYRTSALTLALIAAPLAGTEASIITIPWTVNLALNSGTGSSQIDPFDASHTIGKKFSADAFLASMEVEPGVKFGSAFSTNYVLSLPLSLTLTTPDRARAGTTVRVTPTISLDGTPRFQANGEAEFNTSVYVKGYVDTVVTSKTTFDTGDIPLPDLVPITQSSNIRFGGSGTYQDTDTSATAVLAGAFAKTVPDLPLVTGSLSGSSLGSPNPDARYPGFQLSTSGQIEGWNANVDLLDIAEKIPVIGGAVAVANSVLDLDLRAGVDLVEESTISSGLLYGFYSVPTIPNVIGVIEFNSPANLSSFNVNIPSSASGSFGLEFYALGLGLGLVQQYLYEPNIRLILDAIDPLGSWELLKTQPGEAWDVGRQYTRFNYLDCITQAAACTADGTAGVAQSTRTLAWTIDPAAPIVPPPPPVVLNLPDSVVTTTDALVPGGTDSGIFAGTAPVGEPTLIPVPEPRSFVMLAMALLFSTTLFRQRR